MQSPIFTLIKLRNAYRVSPISSRATALFLLPDQLHVEFELPSNGRRYFPQFQIDRKTIGDPGDEFGETVMLEHPGVTVDIGPGVPVRDRPAQRKGVVEARRLRNVSAGPDVAGFDLRGVAEMIADLVQPRSSVALDMGCFDPSPWRRSPKAVEGVASVRDHQGEHAARRQSGAAIGKPTHEIGHVLDDV